MQSKNDVHSDAIASWNDVNKSKYTCPDRSYPQSLSTLRCAIRFLFFYTSVSHVEFPAKWPQQTSLN